MKPSLVDTIVAIATPPGRGSVGIVRVSGPLVLSISKRVLQTQAHPRQIHYGPFFDATDTVLDQGLALYFKAPNSFTGEDILELQAHGSPVVLDQLVKTICAYGARIAEPGEFSKRAFLNDKMDLAQAEAIADLISAESQQAAKAAMRSLQGEFSKQIQVLVEELIQLRVYVEAAIDFPEEEVDFLAVSSIRERLEQVRQAVQSVLNRAHQGAFLREGIQLVIAGKPNAGKSSLLNCFTGQETAIVTDIPGTTRDVLRAFIQLDGIPIHLIDTAGLRTTTDPIEQEGVRRARQEIEKADIILQVFDARESESEELSFPKNIPLLKVYNKVDLLDKVPVAQNHVVYISATQHRGIDQLKHQIKSLLGIQENTEGVYLARRRHLEALTRALQHLTLAEQFLSNRTGELLAEELKLSQEALSEITGVFTSDDLLGRIFSTFCIGK